MKINFGTDGIRGKVGSGFFTFEALSKFGAAIAQWASEKFQNKVNFIICHDTRESSYWIKSILKSILLLNSFNVYDADILPTPALFYLTKDSEFTCGIIISGSHNQHEENGIKLLNLSSKLSKQDETRILELFNNNYIITNNYSNPGKDIWLSDAEEQYISFITSLFDQKFLKNKKIVLDTANGATYRVAPAIFRKLGADIIVINNNPTGKNINKNCGSLYPSSLISTVKKHNALIGFAFDGDGDRVVTVNKNGELKDGDDLLAILSQHSDYINMPKIIGTVMSNLGLEEFFKNQNKQFIRTQVGDKHVNNLLESNQLLLGGEQSGHIILKNILNSGDGILVALKIIEILNYTQNWDIKTFFKYPQILINLPVKTKKELDTQAVKYIINNNKEILINGRIFIRYSGTENYLRILVEGQDQNLTNFVASNLSCKLKQYLD